MMFTDLFHPTAAIFALLLALLAASAAPAAQSGAQVTVVAFGLFGDQSVFESEAKGAARIVANGFGVGSAIVRANTRTRGDATIEALAATLESVADGMDSEHDVLFLILTSHGSRSGLAVKAGGRSETLSPPALATMLDHTGVRHRVVVISACYSGIFIPRLANADTLVITAADADHPSFGCKDGAEWTYFGDAFFNVALRRTTSLRDAFALARTLVRKRERRNGFAASNPQMAGGENVERLLRRDATAPSRHALDRARRQPRSPNFEPTASASFCRRPALAAPGGARYRAGARLMICPSAAGEISSAATGRLRGAGSWIEPRIGPSKLCWTMACSMRPIRAPMATISGWRDPLNSSSDARSRTISPRVRVAAALSSATGSRQDSSAAFCAARSSFMPVRSTPSAASISAMRRPVASSRSSAE
jgi:hypothetical protein